MADLIDGKYRLLRTIGEGAWGVVFEAENVRTLKRVALKILRPRTDLTAAMAMRFEREAQAAGRIGSEHIVEVFDVGSVPDGTQYMVMELLNGEDLASRIQRTGPLHPRAAAKIAVQLLEGLSAAHRSGILHRDLKPENLFLVRTRSGEDFVKILDFGISKFSDPSLASATMTGAVLGSPLYMSPEQARGLKTVDARTDLYSVGALLFEAVTGRPPFSGDNFNDLMFKIVLSPRPDPIALRPDLDGAFAAALVKSIAVEPHDRFISAAEFRDELLRWLETQGVPSFRAPELRPVPLSREPAEETTAGALPSNRRSSRRATPGAEDNVRVPIASSGQSTMRAEADVRATPRTEDNIRATPIASSGPPRGTQAPRRQIAIVALGAAVVVGFAILGLELRRTYGPARTEAVDGPQPPPLAPPLAPPPSASTPATHVSEPPVQLTPLVPPAPSGPPPAAPLPTVVDAPTVRPESPSPLHGHVGESASRPAASQSGAVSSPPLPAGSAVASASRPLPSPPSGPPAPSAIPSASGKPIGTVEGREFRTGI